MLLAGSFTLVLPSGVIALRLVNRTGTEFHVFLQVFGAVAVAAGVGVGVTMSVIGIQYAHFSQPHQIVGLSVAVLVALQVYFGQAHHIRYKVLQKRTWFSFVHMGLGRVVIYSGMVDAALGFWLCKRTLVMAVAGGLGVVVGLVLEFVATRAHIVGRREAERGERLKGWNSSSNYHKLKDATVSEREVRTEYELNYGRPGKQPVPASQPYEGYRHA